MLIQQWGDVFTASLQNLWFGFIGFMPSLLLAIIIFLLGWFVGSIIGEAINKAITALKVDNLAASIGAEKFFARAGMKLSIGGFIGGLVKWFLVIAFLIPSLELLKMTYVTEFLQGVVLSYLPHVIAAALVLIVATLVADTMAKIIAGSAKGANLKGADFLGTMTRWAIWITAFVIALDQLSIGAQYVNIIFEGLVAMLVIAGGLAFGLGGKDAASRTIEKIKSDIGHGN